MFGHEDEREMFVTLVSACDMQRESNEGKAM